MGLLVPDATTKTKLFQLKTLNSHKHFAINSNCKRMRNNITLNESRRCADGVGDGVEDGDGAGDNKAKLEKRTKQYRFMMWSLSLFFSLQLLVSARASTSPMPLTSLEYASCIRNTMPHKFVDKWGTVQCVWYVCQHLSIPWIVSRECGLVLKLNECAV